MGKTAKWFRSLLVSKKSPPSREKKKSEWALSNSADYKFKNEDPLASPYGESLDANKHAIAVAAATAAVAEAALAAAQAAAEVVRLTSSAGSGRNVPAFVSSDRRRVAAVVKIQSAFRAYLARRALRALKGLVKLQALVRGHFVRRQSADMLRRMQAMARIQARASAHRFCVSDSSKANIKFSYYPPSGVLNPRNYYQWPENAKHGGHTTKQLRASNNANNQNSRMAPNSLNQWIEQYAWNNRSRGDDERSDKILEIDTWKPRLTTRRSERAFSSRNETGQEFSKTSSFSRLSAKLENPNPSISSEDQLSSITSQKEVDHVAVWTAESSPRAHSASSRPTSNLRGMMFTPTRSECSRSLYSDYLSHPSYMANTESSKAKVRSQSVPKQRMMELNELGLSSTFGQNMWESDAVSEKSYALPHNYVKRQLTRTPISSSYGHRY